MWKEAQNPELEGHLSEEGELCPRECDCRRSTDLITEERSVPQLVLSSLQMTWEEGEAKLWVLVPALPLSFCVILSILPTLFDLNFSFLIISTEAVLSHLNIKTTL